MAQYQLNPSSFDPSQVGQSYNLGIGNGTVAYGYNLRNMGGTNAQQGLQENSDVATKDALVNYGSSNLVDRDLVYYPRVTQGDWSGGALQINPINSNQFWDSQLNPAVPGMLQLFPGWVQKTTPVSGSTPGAQQIVSYKGDLIASFADPGNATYAVHYTTLGAMTESTAPDGSPIIGLFTDGDSLFAGTSANLWFTQTDPSSWASTSWGAITNGVNNTVLNWWFVELGNGGRFVYYLDNLQNVWEVDLNASRPVLPAAQAQLNLGSAAIETVDILGYGSNIILLTNDVYSDNGFDLWSYTGGTSPVVPSHIIRVDGYKAVGFCEVLGNYYVGAIDVLANGQPVLFEVTPGGGFSVVSRPGTPGKLFTYPSTAAQPRGQGEFVYWPVGAAPNPFQTDLTIGFARGRILVYDTLTQATWFLPNSVLPSPEWANAAIPTSIRQIAPIGSALGMLWNTGTEGVVQILMSGAVSGPFLGQYGTMISSNQDFSTPGVPKRFRSLNVHHTPLVSGQQITISAFVDQDPTQYNSVFPPTPTATLTNSTLGTTDTTLTMGTSVIGRSMYYTLELGDTGGESVTMPLTVYWVSIEVGGTWTWVLNLDCTSKRRLLNGNLPDEQGVTGKDLYYMIRNAYENGEFLTLYLEDAQSYQVSVESVSAQSVGYVTDQAQNVSGNAEWFCQATLRQVAS